MLDPRRIAEHPESVKADLVRRHFSEDGLEAVDRIVELRHRRNELVGERDDLRAARNTLSRQIGQLMREGKRDEAEEVKAKVSADKKRIEAIETDVRAIEAELTDLSMSLPNTLDESIPDGKSDDDNVEVRRWGTVREFDFEPLHHVDVADKLGIVDMEAGARLAGTRFAVARGAGSRLRRALVNFFLDQNGQAGFTEVSVPYIVHKEVLEGTGQLPKFEEDLFKLSEPLNGADAYLIPTAEVPVTNLHRGEIIEHKHLPLKYTSATPCFRAEAGSAGRDVRGLMRLHQFDKVEMVCLTEPEDSERVHQEMICQAEALLQALELPYRVVLLCAGDIGFSARKCYDLEVWTPHEKTYREISSVSNCGPFQARRMNVRYRPERKAGEKKPKPKHLHTLNGSGLPIGRTLLAILENNQQADGSVRVPKVLVPYVGADVLHPIA